MSHLDEGLLAPLESATGCDDFALMEAPSLLLYDGRADVPLKEVEAASTAFAEDGLGTAGTGCFLTSMGCCCWLEGGSDL